MWGEMGWGGWGMFNVFHMFLWWVLIVLGIVVLAKWLISGSRGGHPTGEDRALGILRERYARGEIGKEEFEARKRDLGG